MAEKPTRKPSDGSFVDQLVTDPKNVPDVMLLYGYPGASSEDGHERLYLSSDLSSYVEIPVEAILHRMAAPKEQDPHGGVTLWVRKDAALVHKMAPAAQALAHYFAGAIQAQGAGPAAARPALTLGGPVCGVTLPQNCQIATVRCTRDTCGIACTVAGPCQTRGADCQTQGASCACTDIGCPTDATPCINTHAVTCGACPSEIAVCQSVAGCQSAGADCTFIGCGHSLACTQGLLCRAAPQAAPAPATAQCGGTLPQLCQQTLQVQCTLNTCAFACTRVTCGVTCFGTCNVTCFGTCNITCNATCRVSCHPTCNVTCVGTCNVTCIGTCNVTCVGTCNVTCKATCNVTCNTCLATPCRTPICTIAGPGCLPTRICEFETAGACLQVTAACPQVTLACGADMQDPGGFAAQARALPTMYAYCSQVCSQMQMGCHGGCPGGTIM